MCSKACKKKLSCKYQRKIGNQDAYFTHTKKHEKRKKSSKENNEKHTKNHKEFF
jgi:hypothetical protein